MDSFFQSLRLKNFTAFSDASFEFVGPGINVFVGENGTGKTHAMKAMFAWMLNRTFKQSQEVGLVLTLANTLGTDKFWQMIREGQNQAVINIRYGSAHFSQRITLDGSNGAGPLDPLVSRPVFIPAIDMMGHSRKFGDIYDVYYLDFDWTVRDVIRLLNIERRQDSSEFYEVQSQLELDALEGRVEYVQEEDRFYLVQSEVRLPMPLVAEGLRKISTLYRLLQNGSITRGTALFWDEPEVNLNPVLMDEVVRALAEIARSGVQIFIATHSYVFLEELRDACTPGEVRYFGFEKTLQGVKVNATDDLAGLTPNPILQQYESLYNRQMQRALKAVPTQ